jgi:hypothetical protein
MVSEEINVQHKRDVLLYMCSLSHISAIHKVASLLLIHLTVLGESFMLFVIRIKSSHMQLFFLCIILCIILKITIPGIYMANSEFTRLMVTPSTI